MGELVDGLVASYIVRYPQSRASSLSRESLDRWTREEIDELFRALRHEPIEPRGNLLFTGDLTKGESDIFIPLANYMETKMIVGKWVTGFLWENCDAPRRLIQEYCRIVEDATLTLMKANLDEFRDRTLVEGALMRYWGESRYMGSKEAPKNPQSAETPNAPGAQSASPRRKRPHERRDSLRVGHSAEYREEPPGAYLCERWAWGTERSSLASTCEGFTAISQTNCNHRSHRRSRAYVLDVPVTALEDYEIDSARDALEALFRMEDSFGIAPGPSAPSPSIIRPRVRRSSRRPSRHGAAPWPMWSPAR